MDRGPFMEFVNDESADVFTLLADDDHFFPLIEELDAFIDQHSFQDQSEECVQPRLQSEQESRGEDDEYIGQKDGGAEFNIDVPVKNLG